VIGALTAMIFAGWSAASADAFVYWTNSSTVSSSAIGRANLDGTSADQSFVSAPNYPNGVAVDGRFVYWTDDGTNPNNDDGEIGRANLDGTNVDQSFITGLDEPEGLAVDANHIYWTESTRSAARI
jgi:virginiamycin B lyase